MKFPYNGSDTRPHIERGNDMKKLITLLLVLTLIVSMTACAGSTATTTAATTKAATTAGSTAGTTAAATTAASNKYDKASKIIIGCVTSITGERAQNGVYTKEALDMWAEEVNAKGGILGKKVEIAYEDDQSTDQGGANAYQKLMSRGDVNATTVSLYSSIVLALEPYVKQYEVATFTGGSSVKMAALKNPYLWQIRYNDTLAGSTMAKAAFNTLKMKKPVIIHESDSFGQGLADATRAELIKLGLKNEEINDFTYNKGEKNFAPAIAILKEKGCDGIIAVSQQIEASLIMMQVKAANLTIPCIGSTSYCSEIAIKNAEAAAENWYSVSDWSPTVTTPEGKAFVERYKAKYKKDPDLPSTCNYDSVQMIKKAIEMANSVEPKAINAQISKISGLVGVASTYTPNADHICATTQFLTKNIGGKAIIQEVVSR